VSIDELRVASGAPFEAPMPELLPSVEGAFAPVAPIVLAVGLEDYYQAPQFSGSVRSQDWKWYPSRIDDGARRLLDLLERFGVQATWFVLGWQAEQNPELVRLIADKGHEIACGPYQLLDATHLTPEQFAADVRRAKDAVESASGKAVSGFRSPTFSVGPRNLWALDVLAELGFRYDSSIACEGSGAVPFASSTGVIWEIPPAAVSRVGYHVNFGAPGRLRSMPLPSFVGAVKRLVRGSKQPALLDLRTWELDPQQPRLFLKPSARHAHYRNMDGVERRLERLFAHFEFKTARVVIDHLEAAAFEPAAAALGTTPGASPSPELLTNIEKLWVDGFERWGRGWLSLLGVSMVPVLKPGDRVLVHRVEEGRLRPGDIGVFYNGYRLIVHRVMATFGWGPKRRYIESGEAIGSWSVLPQSAVIGRVVAIDRNGTVTEFERGRERWFSAAAVQALKLALLGLRRSTK
jgi:polysaccharide deacetylase family protein (PEP-CTERM system associated)